MDYTKFFAQITSRRRKNLIRELSELSLEPKLHLSQPNSINLAGGMPNTMTFPIEDISLTYKHDNLIKLNKKELSTSLQYGAAQGYSPLVEKWRNFQKMWHRPCQNNWDIAFTNGSMECCSKIFEMMIDENEPIMVQTPTFVGVIGALAPLSPEVIEIKQDIDGIIPKEIATECEQRLASDRQMPKLLYVNPVGANPTGTVLSDSRRHEIYRLAQKYNFLIVEDDPYYFIHFSDKQPTSFFSIDTDGRVIRLDSFSKIFSAGIRVGVISAHRDIVNKLIVHVENSTIHSSSLSQMLLYKLFELWDSKTFENHFKDIQKFYQERRDIMLAAVKKHLTGLAEWNTPKGGMFLWIKIKSIDNTLDLVMNKCVPQGLFLLPGNAFNYDSSKPNCYLRLSYSYASPEEIDKGLAILAKIIRQETAKKTFNFTNGNSL